MFKAEIAENARYIGRSCKLLIGLKRTWQDILRNQNRTN